MNRVESINFISFLYVPCFEALEFERDHQGEVALVEMACIFNCVKHFVRRGVVSVYLLDSIPTFEPFFQEGVKN
jgi:hypothetical protein